MKKLNIQKLYIKKANYHAEDNYGNNILVNVNYWENKFTLQAKTIKNDKIEILEHKAQKLAQDLLKRKSRVNFGK